MGLWRVRIFASDGFKYEVVPVAQNIIPTPHTTHRQADWLNDELEQSNGLCHGVRSGVLGVAGHATCIRK